MEVDDELTIGLSFRGSIDNYDSLVDILREIEKIIDDWVTWNVDGDYDFWVDSYD